MKVIVLGAGVIGLCTAYALARQQHEVTVVDGAPAVGSGCSYANGGQLSYSYVAPLAGPGVLTSLPAWLFDREAPVRLRLRADRHQWQWCLAFILACNRRSSRRTTAALFELAAASRAALRHLVDEARLEFLFCPSGKLIVHSDPRNFARACMQAEFQRGLGDSLEILRAEGCLELEPALQFIGGRIVGGIFSPKDETGDCQQFCQELARHLVDSHGVQLVLSTQVRRLVANDDRISHALTDCGPLPGEAFVMALGTGSRGLLKPLGVSLPIYPLKGYSLSLPIENDAGAPSLSVTDYANRVVFGRLGGELRVAGMVDLGSDGVLDEGRAGTLRRQAADTFPLAGNYAGAAAWYGFRPATPSGRPLIGPTHRFANLILNVGHGSLGFTLAMASGALAAESLHRPSRMTGNTRIAERSIKLLLQ